MQWKWHKCIPCGVNGAVFSISCGVNEEIEVSHAVRILKM